MQYRENPRTGGALPILGFGCMRLGRDERAAQRQVDAAIEQGITYFDTAYIYPGNEALLGRLLAGGRRGRVQVATKLPSYIVKSVDDAERIFQAQCGRLQTERIDYYLMHMLAGEAEWRRLTGLGILDWLEDKRRAGRIGGVGFSYHGGLPAFKALIDAHAWDVTMLQYNYYDEGQQAGREGVAYAAGRGVPVIAMEPLRGGRLVRLPREAQALLDALPRRQSPAAWALDWLWDQPDVMMALSGMNTLEAVEENARAAADARPGRLTEAEREAIAAVRGVLMARMRVPCTGCNYCMPCPRGVDIPMCFACYNDTRMIGRTAYLYYLLRTYGRNASRCTRCGACERHCPQALAIRDALAETVRAMERFPYRPARFVAGKLMRLN